VCVCVFVEVCTVLFMNKLGSFVLLISILSIKVVFDIIIIVTFVVFLYFSSTHTHTHTHIHPTK